jgi:hypothetical protein
MEFIKDQTVQTRGFLLMLTLIVGIFKISGSVITANWPWVGILSVFAVLFAASEICFFQFKKKAGKRMNMKGKFGL